MSDPQQLSNPLTDLARQIEPSLKDQYGHLVGGSALWRALGYPTYAAFFRALKRQSLGELPYFKIPRRRGIFCLTSDLAVYLAKAKLGQLAKAARQVKEAANVS
jgi:hypothetical protein